MVVLLSLLLCCCVVGGDVAGYRGIDVTDVDADIGVEVEGAVGIVGCVIGGGRVVGVVVFLCSV